jgi:hypothetical protein
MLWNLKMALPDFFAPTAVAELVEAATEPVEGAISTKNTVVMVASTGG